MKRIALAGLLLFAACSWADVEERNTTQRSFSTAAGARKLIVDGINDRIEVTGYNGNDVQVVVNEHWRADSSEYMAEARRDVKLDMTQEGNNVKLYVDGPFRCRNGCDHERGRNHYSVSFDFVVKVPQDTALELKTVNGGHIRVENSSGDFDIQNVNGGIELSAMAGSGNVHTVNGGIKVSFRENPKKDSSFKTVNGGIEVEFQPNLAADFSVKTFNGSIYTDFDFTGLPGLAPVAERDGNRTVYRSDRLANVRVGAGGPSHKFDTLNGTVRILRRGV